MFFKALLFFYLLVVLIMDSNADGILYQDESHSEVYILTNPAWPGYIKVGYSGDIKKRLYQFNCATPLNDFEIESLFKWPTRSVQSVEALILDTLADRFTKACGEWIKCPKKVAKHYIFDLLEELPRSAADPITFGRNLIAIGREMVRKETLIRKPAIHGVLDSFFDFFPEAYLTNELRLFVNLYSDDNNIPYIALHYPTFFNLWRDRFAESRDMEGIKSDLIVAIRGKSYFKADNRLKRVGGKTTRCLLLSLSEEYELPKGLSELAELLIKEKS